MDVGRVYQLSVNLHILGRVRTGLFRCAGLFGSQIVEMNVGRVYQLSIDLHILGRVRTGLFYFRLIGVACLAVVALEVDITN